MSKKEKNDLELSLTDKIITLIIRLRWWLFGLLVALAIAGVAFAIISSVNSSKDNKLSEAFTPIEKEFNTVRDEENGDFTEVLSKLDEYISSSSRYTNLKALHMRAYIYAEKGDYQNALNDYTTINAKAGKNSYFKSLSLYGMAVANEELGRVDVAKEQYQQIWDEYGKSTPESSSALFALLRFAIKDNDADKQDEYARLIRDNYAYSDYARASEQYIKADEPADTNADTVTVDDAETVETVDTDASDNNTSNEGETT